MASSKEFLKFDAHSHFGRSYLGPNGDPNFYFREAKNDNVTGCVISYGCTPNLAEGQHFRRPCLWSYRADRSVEYFSNIVNGAGEELKRTEVGPNPYGEVNRAMIDFSRKHNQGGGIPRMYVMVLHHPVFDTQREISELTGSEDVIAMKFHGISTFLPPQAISDSTIDVLRRQDKPIIVHTDMYRPEPKYGIHHAYRLNHPLKWIEWAKQSGVKTLITHGARLSDEAISMAKGTENVVIGIAPDLLLQSELERLAHNTDNYLHDLLHMVPPEKLVFDYDYSYNVTGRDKWDEIDWTFSDRLLQRMKEAGFSDEQMAKVFMGNAVRFYGL